MCPGVYCRPFSAPPIGREDYGGDAADEDRGADGRLSLTLPRRRLSTKNPCAPARTMYVCLKLPRKAKCDTNIHSQDARTDLTGAAIARTESTFGLAPSPAGHAPGFPLDSTPIALPRPPQTRAASFKRLYPK